MAEGGTGLGIRKAQKLATRERVLSAARELFEGVGYEETTIRMIAERAGVSVGSVFTTFESKVDIFNYILFEKFEALFGELSRIAPHLKGSCCDRVVSLMSIAYGVECRQLDLMISHLAASHGWPERIEVENARRQERFIGLFRDCLDSGVRAGDLRKDVDYDLFVETLYAVYLRNYRRAFYERLDPDALSELIERQVGLLFRGITAHPAV